MTSILDFLFSSEIVFPRSRSDENGLGDELDQVMKLGIQVKGQLGEDKEELWAKYREKARQLGNRQCRMEFERGFLSAANLALEIYHRSMEKEG